MKDGEVWVLEEDCNGKWIARTFYDNKDNNDFYDIPSFRVVKYVRQGQVENKVE